MSIISLLSKAGLDVLGRIQTLALCWRTLIDRYGVCGTPWGSQYSLCLSSKRWNLLLNPVIDEKRGSASASDYIERQ